MSERPRQTQPPHRSEDDARPSPCRRAAAWAGPILVLLSCGCNSLMMMVSPPPPVLPPPASPGGNTAEHLLQLGDHAGHGGAPDYADAIPARMDAAFPGVAHPTAGSPCGGHAVPHDSAAVPSGDFLTQQPELTLNSVIELTLATHPTLESALEVWQAARQRPDQVSALMDPQFRFLSGVQLFDGLRNADRDSPTFFLQAYQQRFQLNQPVPGPGKRKARGDIAEAEALAASHEVVDVELELLQAAKLAYVDYLTNHHRMTLHGAEHTLLNDYAVQLGQVGGDAAEIEAARRGVSRRLRELKHRSVRLVRDDSAARARLNILVGRDIDSPLPPPRSLVNLPHVPDVVLLRQTALERRPERAAQVARIAAAEHSVRLARLQYLPDYYLVGRLDSIDVRNDGETYRPFLGVYSDVPIRFARRKAAVAEAEALLRRNVAILRKITQQIELDVQLAYDHIPECWQLLELAGEEVEAAYRDVAVQGRTPPTTLEQWQAQLDARRAALRAQEKEWAEWAELYRRLILLERTAAVPLLTDSEPAGHSLLDPGYFQRRLDMGRNSLLPFDLHDIQQGLHDGLHSVTSGWPFRNDDE